MELKKKVRRVYAPRKPGVFNTVDCKAEQLLTADASVEYYQLKNSLLAKAYLSANQIRYRLREFIEKQVKHYVMEIRT